jgi:prolyl oligopeptidase
MAASDTRGRLILASCLLVLLAASMSWPATAAAQRVAYPAAPREGAADDYHGTRVADPFRWLEQPDSPRATEWLKAEERISLDWLAAAPGREAIRRRLTVLADYGRTEVPWREGGRLFFVASTGLQPQPVLYAQKGIHDRPRTFLDPNAISPDGSIAVGDYAVSPDGRLLAYRTSPGGGIDGEIHVRKIATGRELQDVLRDVPTSVCWTRDGRGFFYVRLPPRTPGESASGARIEKQILYHSLGRPQSQDRPILDWKENARWAYCMTAGDGRYAILVAEEGPESDVVVLDLKNPGRPDLGAPPLRLLAGSKAFHTPVEIVGRTLYLRTNLEAPRNRVVALDLTEGAGARPRTVVPESSEVIVDAVVAGDRLVVHTLADVKSRLRVYSLDGRPAGEVALPGIGAVGWPLGASPRKPELFYSFTSFLEPATVYRYDPASGTNTPFRPPRVPFDASAYETRQVFYVSKDGTRVPMFVTARKGLVLDAAHPVFLTAYGGYGAVRKPEYEADIPLWLERGGIYAVANIRGGGEYGEEWHRAGMLARKQTSFDDFIAAAEYLIAGRYTTRDRLAIYGHSNGGLLIGAAITQRPDLFAAAVANAGHYDMLRFHRFTVGAGWISEYGSPDDPAAFGYLRAYSPLHNVRDGICYPATLLLAADHDDTVVPGHSYKFAAALQAAQGCDRPILLRVARDASHGYASRQARIAERSDLWAFVAARLGVVGEPRKQAQKEKRRPRISLTRKRSVARVRPNIAARLNSQSGERLRSSVGASWCCWSREVSNPLRGPSEP